MRGVTPVSEARLTSASVALSKAETKSSLPCAAAFPSGVDHLSDAEASTTRQLDVSSAASIRATVSKACGQTGGRDMANEGSMPESMHLRS